jgi:phosphoglycerate dehydrogenase-like enzyme
MGLDQLTRIGFAFQPGETLLEAFRAALSAEEFELVLPDERPDKQWQYENLIDTDIYIGWRPEERLLRESKRIKLVINPGAGIWHQLKELGHVYQEEGIVLCNGHGNDYFTAQHAVALLLSAMNRLGIHERMLRAGKWRSSDGDGMSIPLLNRKVGLLGYGHINQLVHQFLQGFDVEFHLLRRSWDDKPEPRVRFTEKYDGRELHRFLIEIDTLIVAVPELPETTNLMGERELELLGKGSVLVNVARGKVINEEALYNALLNNTISAAGIDVWYDYQPEPDEQGRKYPYHFPFHELEHVAMSPHRGGSPLQDLYRWQEVFDNIRRYRGGEKLRNVVDLELGY